MKQQIGSGLNDISIRSARKPGVEDAKKPSVTITAVPQYSQSSSRSGAGDERCTTRSSSIPSSGSSCPSSKHRGGGTGW